MRISVISPFVDRQHGTERAVAEFLAHLESQHKDHIDLYAQRVSDLDLKSPSPAGPASAGGITWHRVPSVPGPHLLQFLGWFFLNRFARWRLERAGGNAPSILFSPGINALDADVILVHAVFHRVADLQKSHVTGGLRGRHRKLYYATLCDLERRIYKNPLVTLAAVSRRTAEQLASYFGRSDVTVIPNGVDSSHFSAEVIKAMRDRSRQQWEISPQDFVILLVGNDWRNKGLLTLLQAFAQSVALPLRLLVVGQDQQAFFRSQAKRLGISERVQFFAPVSDVRTFYAAADALVAPSLEDSFNLPVLEAMSCGLPVVVSPRAGVSEWLTDSLDSIVMQDPENADELAQAIHKLALDSGLRVSIVANAIQTAKRLSWANHSEKLRSVLASAVEQKLLRSSKRGL